MAVLHRSRSKKSFAVGTPDFGMANYAVPGLLKNKHMTISIPIIDDEKGGYFIVRLTMEEIDELNRVRRMYEPDFERDS